jgi:hypothetical protein
VHAGATLDSPIPPVRHCFLSPSSVQIVNIAAGISLADFLKLAASKLGGFTSASPARKAFLQDGGALDDAELIRDNDVVYVSAGEAFFRTRDQSAGSASAKKAEQCVTYSIAVMGAGSVGKSAMTLRYVQGVFVKDYDPTIEDAYRKSVLLDDRNCVLDILDTAGQEDYTVRRRQWR